MNEFGFLSITLKRRGMIWALYTLLCVFIAGVLSYSVIGPEFNPDYFAYERIYQLVGNNFIDGSEYIDPSWRFLLLVSNAVGFSYEIFRLIFALLFGLFSAISAYNFYLFSSELSLVGKKSYLLKFTSIFITSLILVCICVNASHFVLRSGMSGIICLLAYSIYLKNSIKNQKESNFLPLLVYFVGTGFHYQSGILLGFIFLIACTISSNKNYLDTKRLNLLIFNPKSLIKKVILWSFVLIAVLAIATYNRYARIDYLSTNMNIARVLLYMISISISFGACNLARKDLVQLSKKLSISCREHFAFLNPICLAFATYIFLTLYLILCLLSPDLVMGSGEAFTRISIQFTFLIIPSMVIYRETNPRLSIMMCSYVLVVSLLLANSYFGQHLYGYTPQKGNIKDAQLQ